LDPKSFELLADFNDSVMAKMVKSISKHSLSESVNINTNLIIHESESDGLQKYSQDIASQTERTEDDKLSSIFITKQNSKNASQTNLISVKSTNKSFLIDKTKVDKRNSEIFNKVDFKEKISKLQNKDINNE